MDQAVALGQLPMADIISYLELNPPSLPYTSLLGLPPQVKEVQKVTPTQFAALTPTEGLEVALEIDATAGTIWYMRYSKYNADGSAKLSSHKWEFRGGSPLYNIVAASQNVSSAASTYGDFPTPGGITLPTGGDFVVRWGGSPGGNSSSSNSRLMLNVGSDTIVAAYTTVGALSMDSELTGIASGTLVKIQGEDDDITRRIAWSNRFISLLPIRLG